MNSSSLTERLLPGTERALLHSVAAAQSEGRAPSLSAAVAREGKVVWSAVRPAGEGPQPGPEPQYRIGSITKTFTAVLVLRLRDEGLLDLGDPLEKHLPGTDLGDVTIAQLLSHTAGVAAETPGLWWERTPASLRPGLTEVLGDAPLKHPVGRRFHYSSSGYTVLGSLVEAVRGVGWAEAVQREILEPLGLERTSVRPLAAAVEGWAVHPYADVLLPEPVEDLGLMAPAGQMWSTPGDLCRFASFLAEGDDRVLSAASVREMAVPAAPLESEEWDGTYGLGVQVARLYGRTMIGHTGSLPGYVAGLWVSPSDGVAAAVLANATSGPQPWAVAAELVRTVAEAEPRMPEPWRPLPDVDPQLLALTGSWFWGPKPHVLKLLPERGLVLAPADGFGRGARFRAEEDGTWTGLDGYYAGETLRVVHRPDGTVRHLDLGSFVLTREPYEPDAGVPGGVDPGGWRGRP
ncbi:serine hydrolase domain-containing protein [Streptomyces sp. NPDC003691]